MKQFLFLELSMFNFPISLDYKNRFKSILVSKHYVNFDFPVKRLTNSSVTFPRLLCLGMQKKIQMIYVTAKHYQ